MLTRQMATRSSFISPFASFRRTPRLPKSPALSSLSLPMLSNPLLRSFSLRSKPLNPRSVTCRRSSIRSLFTGIVEEMGEVLRLGPTDTGGIELQISAKTVLSGVNLGDSIAVNGTCLTVSSFDAEGSHFTVGLAPETLRKTSLSGIRQGDQVNLERALQPVSRMGGHFVQGHVDGTGEIVSMVPEGDSLWVKVRAAPEILRYVVPKGFITVDGVSLTVVGVYEEECCFDFMLVAYTQQKVVVPLKMVGEKVNLEVDILGKYVEKLLKCGIGAGEDAGSS